MKLKQHLMLVIISALTVTLPVTAQTCAATFNTALQTSLNICGGIERNTACYGEERVVATLGPEAPPTVQFTQPADTVEVRYLASVTTEVTEQREIGGVAVLRVQANLPQTLPGQAVVMLLTGAVALEGQNDPATATVPASPVTVTATASANLRAAPGPNAAVLAGITPGEALQVDGRNTTGDWFRVIDGANTYWIFKSVVDAGTNDLTTLPDVTTTNAPMQAFYIRPGVGGGACQAVPNAVLVQNPANKRTTLEINGVQVTIGSTVLFEVTTDGLQLAVFDGNADLGGGLTILPGQVIDAQLAPDGTIQSWVGVRPLDDAQRARYQVLADASSVGSPFNYPFEIPEDAPDLPTTARDNATPGDTVAPGYSSFGGGTATGGGDDDDRGGGNASGGGSNDGGGDNDDDDGDEDGDEDEED